MKLTKSVLIPNSEIGLITITPVGDKIEIENANIGKLVADASVLDSLGWDLKIMARAIEDELEERMDYINVYEALSQT